ncbi:unnamed protein product [Urochloa humidicola]
MAADRSIQEESMEFPSDPDWSRLPADMLVRILSLLEISDLVSSGAVCHSWNLNYLTVRRLGLCSERQSPCLLYSSADRGPDVATLHNISTNKRYHITLPGNPSFWARHVVGCSHGWLVTADEKSELHIDNPITRARLALPSVTTLAPVKLFYTKDRVFIGYAVFDISPGSSQIKTRGVPPHYSVEDTRRGLYLRAFLSSNPGDGSSCTVVLLHKRHNQLSFARPGDSKWAWIAPENNSYCKFYHDCFYDAMDGLFYAIRRTGEVHAINLNGPTPVVNSVFPAILISQDCTKYIVRAPWGDLLQIWRRHHTSGGELKTRQLTVYKMLMFEQVLQEINDLQGHALFIGFNESFFVATKDFPKLSPNCVYLAHDSARYDHLHGCNLQEVLVYNVLDGSFSDFSPRPDSWLNLPPPIWIRPSCSDSVLQRRQELLGARHGSPEARGAEG